MTAGEDKAITLENYKTRSLEMTKIRQGYPDTKLEGAVFDVYGPVGKDSAKTVTVTTDVDGFARVDDMLFGDYTITETSAPSGYRITNEVTDITVDDSAMTFEVTIENRKRTSSTPDPEPEPELPELPEEPEEPNEPEKETEVTDEDTPVGGETEVPEGGDVEVDKKPENGTVEVDDKGKWVYTPDPGFIGEDSFSIIVKDPEGNEEEILIDILVEEIPEGIVELPETAGIPIGIFGIIGSGLVLAGVALRRKK